MNKDSQFLAEAYELIIEKKKKLVGKQKEIAAAAPPPDEITGADFKALKNKKKKKKDELKEAYETVVESVVKKKHYSEYKKLTKWLLDNKDQHGKKDYEKAKARRDQLVSIFKEEGMEPHQVKDSFAKKPSVEGEPKEDVIPDTSASCTQCGDAGHTADNCPDNGGVA